MLTHHRNKARFDIRELALPVPFNSDPLNRPTLIKMFLQIIWNIVFSLASNYTPITTGAPVDIYHHTPFIIFSHLH
jgi:hypothetical protein